MLVDGGEGAGGGAAVVAMGARVAGNGANLATATAKAMVETTATTNNNSTLLLTNPYSSNHKKGAEGRAHAAMRDALAERSFLLGDADDEKEDVNKYPLLSAADEFGGGGEFGGDVVKHSLGGSSYYDGSSRSRSRSRQRRKKRSKHKHKRHKKRRKRDDVSRSRSRSRSPSGSNASRSSSDRRRKHHRKERKRKKKRTQPTT